MDGNREFVRLLQLGLSHPLDEVTVALEHAAAHNSYSIEAVQQVLTWTTDAAVLPAPLDDARYPHYQFPQPTPDLHAYN